MPANYNGNPAGVLAHEAPVVQTALATDLLSEEGFNVGLRKLADYIAYLNQKGALLDAVNLFTAIVQLGTGSGLELTAGVLQSILKKGAGKLQLGTAAANNSDLELLVNGVVKLGLLAAGGIDAKGERLTNLGAPVGATDALRFGDAATPPTASKLALRDAAGRTQFADPAAAQDADTKGARDAAIVAARLSADWSASLTIAGGWQAWASNANGVRYVQNGPLVTVIIGVQATQASPPGTVATLPAGLRPTRALDFVGVNFSTGVAVKMQIGISGSVVVTGIGNAEVAAAIVTFPAQQ